LRERRWSISHKFILFISLSVLVFLVAIFLITRSVLRDYALRTADELAFTILDQTDKSLGQFFEEMEHLAQGLAGTRAVRAVNEEGMKDLFIATVLPRSQYLRAVYLGTVDGRMFEWGEGRGFVNHKPTFPPGYDPRVRLWYKAAWEKKGFAISDPYIYASVNDIGITCALPVTSEDGSCVGILGLDILLDDLRHILVSLDIPKEGKALLLSSQGDILASQFVEVKPGEFGLPHPAITGGEGIFERSSGSFVGAIGGEDMNFVYKKNTITGWTIVVAMPLRTIMESMHALLNLISVIEIILMLLLSTALASITTRIVISPLANIVSVINRIKAGDKGARVSVRSTDEFGVLGEELNMLVDTVDGYSRDLEEKVRLRAEEIGMLQRENTQLRIVEERRRIYRDMHDTIGAKLTNIFFCNGMARDLAKDSPARLQEMLEKTESNCMQAIASLKGIILGMNADDHAASDLAKFVSVGLRQRLESRDIEFDCRIRNRASLREMEGETLGEFEKVLEELVSNVLRHSGAKNVRLRLSMGNQGLSLHFSDNGIGFDPAAVLTSSFGVQNIQYRIERLDGTVFIRTAPGAGTEYTIHIPRKRVTHE
jgi:signal transduction histidine kinase